MQTDFSPQLLSLASRFYARVLLYPYDELTHEFQYLFREVEKNIDSDVDNTIASKILDIVNHYQGEDMGVLQAEYVRLFSPSDEERPAISLRVSELLTPEVWLELDNLLADQLTATGEAAEDDLSNLLEYFSVLLDMRDTVQYQSFFDNVLKTVLPVLARQIFQQTTIGFYRECARGMTDFVSLLED